MAISTKTPSSTNTGGGGFTPKTLQPGVNKCVLHSIRLEKLSYISSRDEYTLILALEGPPVGGSFEGFPKDMNNKSGEKYKGQQSFVKSSNWGFYDGKTNNGYDCSVEQGVIGFLQELCTELGIISWLHGIDNKYNTVQEIVLAFDKEKPFANIWMNYLLASKVFVNKAGYDTHDLHLVRSTKEGKAFCIDAAQIMKFSSEKHIYKPKPKVLTEGFSAEPVKQNGISTKNVSATPITDEMQKEGVQTTGAKTTIAAQSNEEWIKEMNQVETNTSDIITEDNSESLPFELD